VRFTGRLIADTSRALAVQEARHARVLYIPSEDADMGAFQRSDHHSHSPYKGDASYFNITVDGRGAENAVSSRSRPWPPSQTISPSTPSGWMRSRKSPPEAGRVTHNALASMPT